MLDLQLLAYQSNLTRVILTHDRQGAKRAAISADWRARGRIIRCRTIRTRPELIEHMSKINRYHAELFGKYLAKLRATPDGDGTCSIT